MTLRPSRRAVRNAAVTGFVLHDLGALWAWRTWGYFGASNLLVWMGFPASLIYIGESGNRLLAYSLILGGLEWAAIAALLTYLVGRTLKSPAPPPR